MCSEPKSPLTQCCLLVLQAAGVDVSEGALQCCGLPTMVANTHALDVIQVRLVFAAPCQQANVKALQWAPVAVVLSEAAMIV